MQQFNKFMAAPTIGSILAVAIPGVAQETRLLVIAGLIAVGKLALAVAHRGAKGEAVLLLQRLNQLENSGKNV